MTKNEKNLWIFAENNDEFCVKFAHDISLWREIKNDEIFAAVITEAKAHGYNVDADFLFDQVEFIMAGYKLNRFLPDRSGAVFSPISMNGIQFRFAPITEKQQEYVC